MKIELSMSAAVYEQGGPFTGGGGFIQSTALMVHKQKGQKYADDTIHYKPSI